MQCKLAAHSGGDDPGGGGRRGPGLEHIYIYIYIVICIYIYIHIYIYICKIYINIAEEPLAILYVFLKTFAAMAVAFVILFIFSVLISTRPLRFCLSQRQCASCLPCCCIWPPPKTGNILQA